MLWINASYEVIKKVKPVQGNQTTNLCQYILFFCTLCTEVKLTISSTIRNYTLSLVKIF